MTNRLSRHLAAAFVLGLALSACGRTPEGPDPGPGGETGEQITGNERIGWQQPAANGEELAGLRYAAYVDNARHELADVTCDSTPTATGFSCSARLPAMETGRHVIELVAYAASNGIESPRSSPLTVVMGRAASGAAPPDDAAAPLTTADGIRLRADVVAQDVHDATDLAHAPDGRIFVAERAGRIRIVRNRQLLVPPALQIQDVATGGRHGLLALAVAPDFARSGHVYAAYTALDARSSSPTLRVARFRAAGDTLGERAIVLEAGPLSTEAAAALRFGPDGKLYLGVDDGGDPNRAGDMGSFNGKVLRINPDGTTPADQPGGTPVFAPNLPAPRALDWSAWDRQATMWVVDAGGDADSLQAVAPDASAARRGRTILRYVFPPDVTADGLAVYRADAVPAFQGDLFVASARGQALLRLRFDPADRRRLVGSERLLQDVFGEIRAVAIAPDGAIVVASPSAIIRLAP